MTVGGASSTTTIGVTSPHLQPPQQSLPPPIQNSRTTRRRLANSTNAAIQISTDRFAPLERFLEVGRQLQQQQQLVLHHQQQQQQQQQQNRSTGHLRNKIVFSLSCRYCNSQVCGRAMRAILLADTKVELYSTDIPPSLHTATGEEDRLTHGCHCRIRDTLCRLCGNVLGYHVSQPCERCLAARNNGHFWMFYSEVVQAAERADRRTGKPMVWAQLAPMCAEEDSTNHHGSSGNEFGLIGGYECYNR